MYMCTCTYMPRALLGTYMYMYSTWCDIGILNWTDKIERRATKTPLPKIFFCPNTLAKKRFLIYMNVWAFCCLQLLLVCIIICTAKFLCVPWAQEYVFLCLQARRTGRVSVIWRFGGWKRGRRVWSSYRRGNKDGTYVYTCRMLWRLHVQITWHHVFFLKESEGGREGGTDCMKSTLWPLCLEYPKVVRSK